MMRRRRPAACMATPPLPCTFEFDVLEIHAPVPKPKRIGSVLCNAPAEATSGRQVWPKVVDLAAEHFGIPTGSVCCKGVLLDGKEDSFLGVEDASAMLVEDVRRMSYVALASPPQIEMSLAYPPCL